VTRPIPSAVLSVCAIVFLQCAMPEKSAAVKPVDYWVQVNDEAFVVRLVTPEQIAHADARIAGTESQHTISGKLIDGDGGFNTDPSRNKKWSWHLAPESVSFPQITMELCDGRPSDVEGNKTHWINDVHMYCPWAAKFIRKMP